MTTTTKTKTILKIGAAFLLGFILPQIICFVFGKQLRALIPDVFILSVVEQLFETILTIGLIFLFKKNDTLRLKKGAMKEGIGACAALIAVEVVILLAHASELASALASDVGRVLIALMYSGMVGITEEGLFRGLITDMSLDISGTDTHKKAFLGILFPAILFGCLHLVNALSPDISLTIAAVQACGAICAGLIFGAAYFRSRRSIWPCVIVHTLVDFAGFVSGGMLAGATDTEAIANLSVGSLIMVPVYLLVFIYVFRKEKVCQLIRC